MQHDIQYISYLNPLEPSLLPSFEDHDLEEVVGVDLGVAVDGHCNLVEFGVAVDVEVELELCMFVHFDVQDGFCLWIEVAPSIL